MRGGDDLRNLGGAKLGGVDAISIEERWIDIKKRGDSAAIHPEAIFSHTVINTDVLANALVRIGEWVADHGMEGDGPYQAARDLLMRMPPRIGGQQIQQDGESSLDAAIRVAGAIEGGLFPIQGTAGRWQDPYRCAHDLCPRAGGQNSRRDCQQPQGYS